MVAMEYFYMRRQEAKSELDDLGHLLPDDFSNATSYFIKKERAQQVEMEKLSTKKVVDEKISISGKEQKINKSKQFGSFHQGDFFTQFDYPINRKSLTLKKDSSALGFAVFLRPEYNGGYEISQEQQAKVWSNTLIVQLLQTGLLILSFYHAINHQHSLGGVFKPA
jgi:hypothetical protein